MRFISMFAAGAVLLLTLVVTPTPVLAQTAVNLMPVNAPVTPPTGTLCDTEEVRLLWSGVNEYRRQANLLPLPFDPMLCKVAEDHANDIAGRPFGEVGNLEVRDAESPDETFIDDWLREVGYQPYFNAEYVADIRAGAFRDLTVRQRPGTASVLEYLYNNQAQEKLYNLTLSTDYREIGIAYYETSQTYIYVFIFGSQPNVLPVIPVNPNHDRDSRYEYAYEWKDPQVGLLIHDENYTITGEPPFRIGQVTQIQVSGIQQPGITCPDKRAELPPDWINFPVTNSRPYVHTLSGDQGYNTIYVRSCDARLMEPVENSVTVSYNGRTPVEMLTPSPPPVQQPIVSPTPNVFLTETAIAGQRMLSDQSTQIAQNQIRLTEAAQTQAAIDAQNNTYRLTQDALQTEQLVLQTEQAAVAANQIIQNNQAAELQLTNAALNTQVAQQQQQLDANSAADNATATQSSQIFASATRSADNLNQLNRTATAISIDIERNTAEEAVVVQQQQPSPAISPTPSATWTPFPTATPTPRQPVPRLNLYWNQQMFIIYNASNQVIPLDTIRRLRFVNPQTGASYSGSLAVDFTEAEDFLPERCILVDNTSDNIDQTRETVKDFRRDCDVDFGLTARAAAPQGAHVWSYTRSPIFEVYFNNRLITTCPSAVSNQSECEIP